MADYIPSTDGDFDAWQANFITYASANAAALGLDPLVDIPPLTRPLASVDARERLQHTISFADEATPTRRAKPSGVRGVQLWRKIGDPAPVDESELVFVSEFTRTRMTLDYQMTQGGQTVYYQARSVSTRGDTGPWGELVSATVVK